MLVKTAHGVVDAPRDVLRQPRAALGEPPSHLGARTCTRTGSHCRRSARRPSRRRARCGLGRRSTTRSASPGAAGSPWPKAGLSRKWAPRYACRPMTTTKTATGAVVDFIRRARLADFPAEAVTIGKRCIIDGLGVMLAGLDAGRRRASCASYVRGQRTRAPTRRCSAPRAVPDRRRVGRARQRHERPRAGLRRHAALDERRPHLRPADASDDAAAGGGARASASGSASRARSSSRRFSPASRWSARSPRRSTRITTRRAFTRRARSARSARRSAAAKLLGLDADADGARARDRREHGVGHPRELRHDDQAAARRPRGAERRHRPRSWRRAASPAATTRSIRRGASSRSSASATASTPIASSAGSATRTRSSSPACRSSRIRAACSAIRRWTRCGGW